MTVVIRKKFSASRFWDDCIKYNCTVSEKGKSGAPRAPHQLYSGMPVFELKAASRLLGAKKMHIPRLCPPAVWVSWPGAPQTQL